MAQQLNFPEERIVIILHSAPFYILLIFNVIVFKYMIYLYVESVKHDLPKSTYLRFREEQMGIKKKYSRHVGGIKCATRSQPKTMETGHRQKGSKYGGYTYCPATGKTYEQWEEALSWHRKMMDFVKYQCKNPLPTFRRFILSMPGCLKMDESTQNTQK